MSTHPKMLRKMIPSDAGIASTAAGRLPAWPRRSGSGPHIGPLSRAAWEEIPVQLGNRAHDGGTRSRLGLRRRPHVRRSSRGTGKRAADGGLEEALLLAAPAD